MGCGCQRNESCGDTCDRLCPCIAMYPSHCTAFICLLLSGVLCAIFGAYAFISFRLSIFRFDWPLPWFLVMNAALIPLATIVPLVLLALLLWSSCSTRARARVFKAVLLLLLFLAFVAVAASLVAAVLVIYGLSVDSSFVTDELEAVWTNEVKPIRNSTIPCRIQLQMTCRGFFKHDCRKGSNTANFSRCATICRPQDEEGRAQFDHVVYPGCHERIASYLVTWNAVLLSGCTIACLLILIALFVSCGISFEHTNAK